MDIRYTRHAIVDSMPDEKITRNEVENAVRKAEMRVRIGEGKYRFAYKDVEVICVRTQAYWLAVTCHRRKE